jgi:hypothetical protein
MCARVGDDTEVILLDEIVSHLSDYSAIAKVGFQTVEGLTPLRSLVHDSQLQVRYHQAKKSKDRCSNTKPDRE